MKRNCVPMAAGLIHLLAIRPLDFGVKFIVSGTATWLEKKPERENKMPGKPHREWFKKISKKVCPCGASRHKLRKEPEKAEVFQVLSWGEYVCGKWRTVDHVCPECVESRLTAKLQNHLDKCGCSFQFTGYRGQNLPGWIQACETKLNDRRKS